MIVLDASVVVELVVGSRHGLALVDRLAERDLFAPELLDLEVLQVLRRMVYRGDISVDHAEASVDLLSELPLTRHGHGPLTPRIWELRQAMTAYDAAYVALAESLGAPLWTRDAKLLAIPARIDVIVL